MPDYDALAAEEQRLKDSATPVAPVPVDDVYGAMAAQEAEQQQAALKASIAHAVRVPPEQAGAQRSLAERTGLPLDVVSRNQADVEQQQRAREVYDAAAHSPILAQQLLDPEFAKIAQDDTPALTTVERILLPVRAATAGLFASIPAGLLGLGEAATKTVAPIVEPIVGTILPQNPVRLLAAAFERSRKYMQRSSDIITGSQKGISGIERGVASGFTSFGQMAPGLIASGITGNPQYALAAGSVLAGTQATSKAFDAGKTPAQALTYGLQDAVAEYATEMIPVGRLIKDIQIGAPFWKILTHQLMTEVPTELAATAWQNLNEKAALHPEQPFSQYLAELPDAEAQTVVATVATTVLTAGFGRGLSLLAQRQEQAQQVDYDAAALAQLLQHAAGSKLRERSPTTFTQFVAQAAEAGSAPDAVYIDGATFAQAAQQVGLDLTKMPETAAALEDAVNTKSDVRIPIGEFAATVPGSTLEQSLVPLLKTDPNGATLQEVNDKAWVEETQRQTERLMEEQNFTDGWKQSTDVVKNELLAQLNAANRFTPDVNNAYASFMSAFYSTQAHRFGITPDEMYVRYPLQIQAKSITGENVMTQHAAVEDFTPGRVKDVLQKENWTILTAENPNAQQLSPDENAARMAQLKAALDARGLQYTEVKGKYGSEENSLLITGVTPEQASEIGKQFGQESVLTRHGLIYQDNTVNPATGITEHTTLPDDFYSVVPSTGAAFSVDLNFDERVPLNMLQQDPFKYTGHAEKSGLQKHSLGETYPWTVIAEGDLRPVKYRAVNLISEQKGELRDSFAEAAKDIPGGEVLQTETPAFKAWFGDSKVVDAEGMPLVVYHGTKEDISVFDASALGSNVNNPTTRLGFFFTDNSSYANVWHSYNRADLRSGQNILPVYLGIKNPQILSGAIFSEMLFSAQKRTIEKMRKEAEAKGFDGFKVTRAADETWWVAFRPEQIKSAIGNRGTFDANDPNILHQDELKPWYYSELARQIDAAKMESAPAKAWKDYIRGLTQKGVKQMEIESTGINEWLDLPRADSWQIGLNGDYFRAVSSEEFAEQNVQNLIGLHGDLGYKIEFVKGDRIAKEEVQEFLRENGVQVEERILTGNSEELEYYESEAETDDPDTEYLRERAQERINEMSLEEQADALGIDVDEMEGGLTREQEQTLRVRFYDEEKENYYIDSESPQSSTASLTVGGVSYDFNVAYIRGDVQIWDAANQREVPTRNRSVEEAIRDYALENIPDFESEAQYGIEDYNTPGGEDYFELLLTLPGRGVYNAPHFGDVPDLTNLLVHARANTRTVLAKNVADTFPNLIDAGTVKILFVEEIQSDWAQEAREKGIKQEFTAAQITEKQARITELSVLRQNGLDALKFLDDETEALRQEFEVNPESADLKQKYRAAQAAGHAASQAISEMLDEQRTLARSLDRGMSSGVERAPFITKTDAVLALAMKRLIRYAAENGYDAVSWTRGDQQVERWSGGLQKRVDAIVWTKTPEGVHLQGFKGGHQKANVVRAQDGTYYIRDMDGNPFIEGIATQAEAANLMRELPPDVAGWSGNKVVDTTYAENSLSDAIGKAMGKQILEDPSQTGVIEGADIRIDDIGMSQVYGDAYGRKGDGTPAIMTKVANEVLKKLGGGKVTRADLGIDSEMAYEGPEYSLEQVLAMGEAIRHEGDDAPVSRSDWLRLSARILGQMQPGAHTKKFSEALLKLQGESGFESFVRSDYVKGKVKMAGIGQPTFEVTPALKAKSLSGVPLFQDARGQISFANDLRARPTVITLLEHADLSTFVHESGHFFLEVMFNLARQRGASTQTTEDVDRLLEWFGLNDHLPRGKSPMEYWQSMTLEEKRPYHEQFARGFEAYMFEGKSPNVEMQSLFSRFRAWLINVYKSLLQLNVTLTDEVRGVMDRMLATNDEITQAETARQYHPLFETKPEGMSDAEWLDYQQNGADATQEAVDQLQARSLRDMQYASNAKSAVLRRLQASASAKRKAIRAEVTAEVEAEPVYAAQRFLRRGEMVAPEGERIKAEKGYKLDAAALAEMYPATALARPDLTRLSGLTAAEGLHPNLVAEMFGFTSGDELVRTLADIEPARQKIDGITDQRMLERYGDLADKAGIEKAANEAVHNDVRARFVATELRTLDKAVGNRTVLMKAAKDFAATLIARKKVRTIKPSTFEAAEARSARNAEKALKKNDLTAAAAEKRTQIVNLYASKAAYAALDEVDKGVAFLKRIGDSKALDAGYREQINALLERFDLRKVSAKDAARRTSLVQWIEEMRAQNMEPVIDPALENEATRKPYQDMTLEEFRGLVDSIRNIAHLGRLKNRLLTEADKRAFAVIVDEASESIRDNAKRVVPVSLESNTWADKMKTGVAEFFAMHRKFSSLLRELDGFKDNGVLQRLLVHTANARGAREAVMHEQATIHLSEMMKPLFESGKMNEKVFIPEINASLSREGRVMVALNTGNEGNLQRLMDGDHWTRPQVQAVIDTLSKQDMDFVQGVWDFVESYRAQIGEQQKRLTGLEPEWVEPTSVVTKHGEYRGGYIPAKYDTSRSTRSLSDEAAAGLIDAWRAKRGAAKTRDSFTKERADKVIDRPLRKDFGVITQHITEVTHRLAWQEWLVDANRLLRARAIDGAIREHYGPEVINALRDAVEDIAAGQVPAQNAFERGINYLRQGATIAGLGWRLTTSLLQPLGLTQSMVRIGPKWVGAGLAEWLGDAAHMESTTQRIFAKSDFMRLRAKTMQREISEIRDQVANKNSALEASYFYLITKMQLVADIPTWLGQYHKAVAGGADEANAVSQADQAVLDAQGGGQIKDLSAVQRGGPLLKLFTNFYSFFNTTYNLTAEVTGRTNFKSPLSVGLMAVDMLLLYSVPAALGTLMKFALGDDWDWDKLKRNLVADQLGYMLGTMVGLREVAGIGRTALGLPGDYSGPASLRVFGALADLGTQANQGDIDAAFLKALNNSAGLLFHYPAGQINNTADGLEALATGKTKHPGVLAVGSTKN